MKRNNCIHRIWPALSMLLLLISGCSPNKFLTEGDMLYRGHAVALSGPEIPEKPGKISGLISSKLQPKPNKKFLGLFYTKIWLYEKVNPKEGKEKGLKYWLKNKVGEKPVLASSVDTALMTQVVRKLAQDEGFFNANVFVESTERNRAAKLRYVIEHKGMARIASFQLPEGATGIDSIINAWDGYSIKEGEVYKLENFKKDRTDLAHHIRGQGYYDFYDRNILYLIDTARADSNLGVSLRVRRPEDDSLHRIYHIRNIDVYPTYEAEEIEDSVVYKRTYQYHGLTFHQHRRYINAKALHKMLLIEPGSRFSIDDYDATINRLINTGIFRYVTIDYNKTGSDSLDAKILLTPSKYQGIKVEVEASTSNRSFLGSLLSVSYNNGNLFRGAEYLTLKASGGTEFQFIDEKATLSILNLIFEARLDIPGLYPVKSRGRLRSGYMPKTYLEIVDNFQKDLEYYTINSLSLGAGYEWQAKEKFNHRTQFLALEWVNLLNTTPAFDERVEENPELGLSFNPAMILGPSYAFNVTSRRHEAQNSYVYYSIKAELAGNLPFLIGSLTRPDKEGPYEVLGVAMSNFFQVDNEIRHSWIINRKMSLVSRVGVGVGVAYGNSEVLPYVRQFFMGGPNSLRAFEFRTLGPGSYSPPDDDDDEETVEQYGDLKLLMNLEYRFTIYRFLKGAFFADAGNVWLLRDDPSREGGNFDINRFYREIALGSGIGIRLDFDFFAIRVDMGVPIFKPYNDDGERWLTQFPEQGFKDWRKENWVWNIAIGYPF